MTGIETIALAAFIVVAYNFAAYHLSKSFQPLRNDLIDSIQRLSDDQNVDVKEVEALDRIARDMFNPITRWVIVLFFPIGFIFLIANVIKKLVGIKDKPKYAESALNLATFKATIGLMAPSPICMAIFFVELFLVAVVIQPFGLIYRRTLSRSLITIDLIAGEKLRNGNGV